MTGRTDPAGALERAVILCLVIISLAACATIGFKVKPRTPLNPIGLIESQNQRKGE